MKISIIGGGIGGLTLGNILKQHNIDFKIYESASEIKPVGAGIAIAGNAMKIFDQLGLKEKIEQAGNKMQALIITDENLNTISKTDVLKLESKYKVCNIAIHRAELQKILSEKISENIILNKRLDKIERKENYHLTFTDKTTVETDIVFGADGIKSVVRNQILKNGKLRDAKQKCWRGILEIDIPQKYNHSAYEMWGKGKRFGFVKIKENTLYWYALVNENLFSEGENLLTKFRDFDPYILELISKTPQNNIILNDIFDLQPMDSWHTDNLCLIGDAAHAMTPNMGQGACQAVEDAYVIGKLLEKHTDWNDLFSQFYKIRIKKVNHIVNTSWRLGKVAQWENFTQIRNFALRNLPEKINQKQMEKLLILDL